MSEKVDLVSEKNDDPAAGDAILPPGDATPETGGAMPSVVEAMSPAGDQEPHVVGAMPSVDDADPQVGEAGDLPPAQFRLRRAPRYRPFGLTGAAIGVVAGVVLALSFTAASNYSMQTIAGYFAAILGLTGTVLGLGVAVLIERRRS